MEMDIKLERPLVFFDLETTHLDVNIARIVEIALVKLFPDGMTESFLTRINPGIPIPAETTRIHGINNFDVMDKPTFREVAVDIYSFIKDCDLAGYNLIAYDLPILMNELRRAGIDFSTDNVYFVDVMTIFKQKERRNLTAAYRFYCQKELKDAHSALKDTQATLEIFQAQIKRYPDLPNNVEELHQFCNQRDERFVDNDKKFIWQDEEACFTFGKYKGSLLKKVAQNDAEYLTWMLGQDFSPEVQQIIRSALTGQFPVKEEPKSEEELGD
jgi:DNA polymerase-3 subunit epsilon